jgi:hypothetical protein
MRIFGSTKIANGEEDRNDYHDSNRDEDVEADSPCRVIGYDSGDQRAESQRETLRTASDRTIDRSVPERRRICHDAEECQSSRSLK